MKKIIFSLLLCTGAAGICGNAWANPVRYKVTITNLLMAQKLSPPLIAIHGPSAALFSRGDCASPGLTALAEEGDKQILKKELQATGQLQSVAEGMGPIEGGQSVSFELEAHTADAVLSFASMLATTNDGFAGATGLQLPAMMTLLEIPAYDAGTEENTERCAHIPGPPCGSHNVRVPTMGMVEMHPGILGGGDLNPAIFGWTGPVAKIEIIRL